MNATGEMIVMGAIAFAFLCLIALIVVVIVAIRKSRKKKKAAPARQLSIEEKIMILDNRLASGVITKEVYDAQKASLLKNL